MENLTLEYALNLSDEEAASMDWKDHALAQYEACAEKAEEVLDAVREGSESDPRLKAIIISLLEGILSLGDVYAPRRASELCAWYEASKPLIRVLLDDRAA